MKQPPPQSRHPRLWLSASLAVLALAACNKADQQAALGQVAAPQAALPLTTAAEPAGAAAPSLQALPSASPARVVRLVDPRERYAYVDRAYQMSDAFADAPPDYAFDYGGVRPWVWESDAGAYRMVEPLSRGQRYYYYQPGEDLPFLIRDPDYTYGFDRGQLVVVYDRQGRVLPPDLIDERADFAGRYLARSEALFREARRARREAVAQANWIERRRELAAERRDWEEQQAREEDWRAFHAQHEDEEHDRWAQERLRREAEAARLAQAMNDRASADRNWQQARSEQAWLQQRRGAGPSSSGPTAARQAQSGGSPSSTDQAQFRSQQGHSQSQPQPNPQPQNGQGAQPEPLRQQHAQVLADQQAGQAAQAKQQAAQQAQQQDQAKAARQAAAAQRQAAAAARQAAAGKGQNKPGDHKKDNGDNGTPPPKP